MVLIGALGLVGFRRNAQSPRGPTPAKLENSPALGSNSQGRCFSHTLICFPSLVESPCRLESRLKELTLSLDSICDYC